MNNPYPRPAVMDWNPLQWRHTFFGIPLRHAQSEPIEDDLDLGVALGLATITAVGNLAAPLSLINSGFRGQKLFEGITYGAHTWDAVYHYTTKASAAERFGASLGGRVHAQLLYNRGKGLSVATRALRGPGYKIGGRIGGRLIPGVGWALLAYDVYDIAVNRSLWGFDLS